MNTFEFLIKDLNKNHRNQLNWFFDNKSKQFQGWLPPLSDGSILATKAKGIYKPKDNEYALSIRSSLSSSYNDNLKKLTDGKFIFNYFQENLNPKERDLEYTNIGMKNCLKDKIPIGVFTQIKIKPNPIYEIIGVGVVKSWDAGFFLINGFDINGEI